MGDSSRKFYRDLDGKKYRIGNVDFVHRKQGLFFSIHVDDIKMVGKKQNLAPMWKKLTNNVDLDQPTSFLDHVFWDALNVNTSRTEFSLRSTKKCSNHEFLLKQLENYHSERNFAQKLSRGPTILTKMRQSA